MTSPLVSGHPGRGRGAHLQEADQQDGPVHGARQLRLDDERAAGTRLAMDHGPHRILEGNGVVPPQWLSF